MKSLPNRSWISFCGLHKDTGEADLQAALAAAGVQVDLKRISVVADDDHRTAYAVISLSREHTRKLLQRALMNPDGSPVKLHGRDLAPLIPNRANPEW